MKSLLLAGLVALAPQAHALGSAAECESLADWAATVADARDADVPLVAIEHILKKNKAGVNETTRYHLLGIAKAVYKADILSAKALRGTTLNNCLKGLQNEQ